MALPPHPAPAVLPIPSGPAPPGPTPPGPTPSGPTPSGPADLPGATALLLQTFADFYRQEVGAEEDVHRTLPFFGTALGIVIGALAYAAGRLPRWTDLGGLWAAPWAARSFAASLVLLGFAVLEAALVLFWLSRAIARRNYGRLGPEPELRRRLAELQVYYDAQGVRGPAQDQAAGRDLQAALLDSYAATTPANRALNGRRLAARALAASHLVRSLIWALLATSIILLADKLGIFPRLAP